MLAKPLYYSQPTHGKPVHGVLKKKTKQDVVVCHYLPLHSNPKRAIPIIGVAIRLLLLQIWSSAKLYMLG